MRTHRRPHKVRLALLGVIVAAATGRAAESPPPFDPLAAAVAHQVVSNFEATVPPQCYTRTAGVSNPCWTCHTVARDPNFHTDLELQEEYAFSRFATTNRWRNLFVDRRAAIAAIPDGEILGYIRQDNYTPLRSALLDAGARYPGWVPDLDLGRGFDEEGFARDGSGWRAIRFKPFPGTFWPTNGSTDDVFIRLPQKFRSDLRGQPSLEIYKTNLAILEAAVTWDPDVPLRRVVEPVDERRARADLDGDGRIGEMVSLVRRLPAHYAGAAAEVDVAPRLYPQGTELLHTVRYVDPDAAALLSTRMKEVRYSRKVDYLDTWGLLRAEEKEADEKAEGALPFFTGSALVGLRNVYGWQLQGFIEDAKGRLRVQTAEELRTCMGCHSNLGVTVDQTFALPRKVPGAEGWRPQDLAGTYDAPQSGHKEPEVLTYLRRVQAGDEYRANAEMIQRFFGAGKLDEAQVRRAAKGGDRDLRFLLAPSRARALALDKAYLLIVREQSFELGRDTLLGPISNVHREVKDPTTGLEAAQRVYTDGKLWLDW